MAKKSKVSSFLEKYGWKVITGTVLLTAGQVVDNYWPEYAHVGQLLMMIGTALGGFGLVGKFNKAEIARDKISKECKK